MDSKLQRRFTLGRQSSGAPENDVALASDASGGLEEAMDSGVRLMYLANEGDLEGIQELLDSGTTVNFRDIDGRSALHVAACQGRTDVVDLLLRRGAEVDVKDRWGSTVCCTLVRNWWILCCHIRDQCDIFVGNGFPCLLVSSLREAKCKEDCVWVSISDVIAVWLLCITV